MEILWLLYFGIEFIKHAMNRKTINILIPSLLLLLALALSIFGSNLFSDGYGLKRDKLVTSPIIMSTNDDYASIEYLNGHTTYLTFVI